MPGIGRKEMIDGLTVKDEELVVPAMGSADAINRVKKALSDIDGVERLDAEPGLVSVSYYPDVLSLEIIKKQIENLGYSVGKRERKGRFQRLVDRMIESNQKSFGSQRLDCCDINSKKKKA
jgi:copper chaperone CopZ